jgi:uncharacterized protein (DUF58 family)
MLLVDMSGSGRFGTADNIKQETAAEIAAILAFNAIRNNDKVGAILFSDQVEKYIPPKKGSSHVWRVIKEIFSFAPQHRGTDIAKAVGYLGRVSRKRSVAFLISDFLLPDPGIEFTRQLQSVSRKHEVIAVLISDPGEFCLPEAGIIAFEDMETGALIHLDASHGETRKLFEEHKRKGYADLLSTFKTKDIDCIQISTGANPADALTRYFRMRERRKR